MARVPYDGIFNAYYAVAVADKNAPTVAEITGATAFTMFVTKDGYQPNVTQNKVDSSTIAETFDAQIIGTDAADLKFQLKRETPTDTAWDLFDGAYRDNAFIIVDEFNDTGTLPGAGDPVTVFPVQVGRVQPANSAVNTEKTFMVDFAVTSAPAYSATVAA